MATAKLELWARLQAHAQSSRTVLKLGLLVGGKPPTRISQLSPSPLRQPLLSIFLHIRTRYLNLSFVREYVPINPISIIYPTKKADPSADTLARPDFSRKSSAKTVATYPQRPNTSCLAVHGHRRPRSFRCRRSWKVR